MSQLKYFEGKIVTILTTPINRNFKEEAEAVGKSTLFPANLMDHFVGRFESYDSLGLTLNHPDPTIGTKAYYLFDKIVGIIEEQELNPNDPQEAALIEKYKESKSFNASQKSFNIPQKDKVYCPQGHALDIPPGIKPGSFVACPKCQTQFQLPNNNLSQNKPAPINNSNFVDIDGMSKLADEAKSQSNI